MSLVTIRGELGSGAPEIGREVASKLHFDYVDREIIAEVAARLQREEHDVIAKEMPPGTLLGRIIEALTSDYGGDVLGGAYLPAELIPLGDTRYVGALKSVVRELARGESIVIRGRGSQFILKEYPGSLHVLVVAPLEVRVERVMQDLKIDREAACQEIARFDRSRHEFVKRYFQAELEDPLQYDLVINTGRLSFNAAVSNIINAFRSRTRTGRRKGKTG
jgi:cytidylate kinase